MSDGEWKLWQMDRKDSLEANMLRAMEVFEKKSGHKADIVLINLADLVGHQVDCVGFEIQPMANVQPGTLWVGRKEQ